MLAGYEAGGLSLVYNAVHKLASVCDQFGDNIKQT